MDDRFKLWLGQVTTGHGVMILAPTLLSVLSGSMDWSTAIPLMVAGVAGLLWPENSALGDAARELAKDIGAALTACRNPPSGPSAA